MEELHTCRTCLFFEYSPRAGIYNDTEGKCHRYPPVMDPNYYVTDRDGITESSVWWVFPLTDQYDVCGEYKQTLTTVDP